MTTWQIIAAIVIITVAVVVVAACMGGSDIDQDMPSRPDDGRRR